MYVPISKMKSYWRSAKYKRYRKRIQDYSDDTLRNTLKVAYNFECGNITVKNRLYYQKLLLFFMAELDKWIEIDGTST